MKKQVLLAMLFLAAMIYGCSNDGQTITPVSTHNEDAQTVAEVYLSVNAEHLTIAIDGSTEIWTVKCHTAWGSATGHFICTDGKGHYQYVYWNDNANSFEVAGGLLYSHGYAGHVRYYSAFQTSSDDNC